MEDAEHHPVKALATGFDHVGMYHSLCVRCLRLTIASTDTAQSYRNEEEAGQAIASSGLKREEVFITTKFSGRDNLSIAESIQDSLKKVRIPCLLLRSSMLELKIYCLIARR